MRVFEVEGKKLMQCLNLVARNMVQTLGLVQCFDRLAGRAENSAGHEKTRIHIISK
jgi:hypothetical protein